MPCQGAELSHQSVLLGITEGPDGRERRERGRGLCFLQDSLGLRLQLITEKVLGGRTKGERLGLQTCGLRPCCSWKFPSRVAGTRQAGVGGGEGVGSRGDGGLLEHQMHEHETWGASRGSPGPLLCMPQSSHALLLVLPEPFPQLRPTFTPHPTPSRRTVVYVCGGRRAGLTHLWVLAGATSVCGLKTTLPVTPQKKPTDGLVVFSLVTWT